MVKYSVMRGLHNGLVVTAVILAAASGILSTRVSAQDGGQRGLSISPPTFELSANPGDTLTNSIRLSNISDEELEVTVDVRNFSAQGEEGQVSLESGDETYSITAWTDIAPSEALLGAGESKDFTFTINVPANGEPGGHFGSVVFATKIPPREDLSGATVGQELGALVLLRVAGEARESLTIESFQATQSGGPVAKGPVPFEARVKNQGNVFLKPKGIITVTDTFGRKVGEFPLEGQNVLPDAVRKMNAQWPSSFLIGKYNAQLTLTYGVNNSQIVTANTAFWAFPYKNAPFMIGLAIVLLLIYANIVWRKRIRAALRVLLGKG